MDDLIEQRADLELAYAAANEAISEARDNAKIAKAAVIEFDQANPLVMENAKFEANRRKQKAGEAARKQREADAQESEA